MRRILSACLVFASVSIGCGRSGPPDTCGIYPPVQDTTLDPDSYHDAIDWAVTDLQSVPEFSRDQICSGLAKVAFIRLRDDLNAQGAFTVGGRTLFGMTSLNQGLSIIDISAPKALTSTLTHELAHAVQIDTSPNLDPRHERWEERGIQHAINMSATDISGYGMF